MKKIKNLVFVVATLLAFSSFVIPHSADAATASSSISPGQSTGNISSTIYFSKGQVHYLRVINQVSSNDVYVNVRSNGTVIYSTIPIPKNTVWDNSYTTSNAGYHSVQVGCVSGTNCRATAHIFD